MGDARGPSPPRRAPLRFLYCASEPPAGGHLNAKPDGGEEELQRYARKLAHALQAHLMCVRMCSWEKAMSWPDVFSNHVCDLIFVKEYPPHFLMPRGHGDRCPSLLIGKHGNWPIRRILLLMRGEATDAATVEWTVRVAAIHGSCVTAMVILPPLVDKGDHQASAIADVLARHTTQGRYVRQVLKRMAMLNIDSSLRVGQGRPAWQVRHEVARKTYDLVITSIEPAGRLLNRHLERLIEPLQHWTSAPILVARFPTTWLGKP